MQCRNQWRTIVVFSLLAAVTSWAQQDNARERMAAGMRAGGERERMGMGNRPMDESVMLARMLNSDAILNEIGVSDAQADALRDHMADLNVKRQQLESELQNVMKQHMEQLQDFNSTEAELMQSVERVGEARTHVAKLHIHRIMAIRATLSPMQINKAREIMEKRMEEQRDRQNRGIRERMRERLEGERPEDRQGRERMREMPERAEGGMRRGGRRQDPAAE